MEGITDETLLKILDRGRVSQHACVKPAAQALCLANVRAYISAHGISQRAVAEACGMSDVSLSYAMNGRPLRLDRLLLLGRALGIQPLDDLWLGQRSFARKYKPLHGEGV